MLFDFLEVSPLIAMIRSSRIAAAIGYVDVEVVNGRRNPYGRNAHARKVRHLRLNAREVASPVSPPVRFSRIVHPRALRRVVVRAAAVEKTVCDDLIDGFALEVRRERYDRRKR